MVVKPNNTVAAADVRPVDADSFPGVSYISWWNCAVLLKSKICISRCGCGTEFLQCCSSSCLGIRTITGVSWSRFCRWHWLVIWYYKTLFFIIEHAQTTFWYDTSSDFSLPTGTVWNNREFTFSARIARYWCCNWSYWRFIAAAYILAGGLDQSVWQ